MDNIINFEDNSEIFDLKFLGNGMYANVYKKDDIAIKCYKLLVHGEKNRNLKMKKTKIKLMKKRQNNIKNTELPVNLLYVNGEFFGFYYSCIEGKTLYDEKFKLDLDEKIDACHQLLNNSRELAKNKIYCLDYKLDNIMYDNNKKVRIIDTDDEGTKVTLLNNPIYLQESLYYLKRTILELLYDDFNIRKSDEENIKSLNNCKEALILYKKKLLTYKYLESFVDEFKTNNSNNKSK